MQTSEGISLPPNPKSYTRNELADDKKSTGQQNIILTQNIQAGITNWPDEPLISTVDNPAKNLSTPIGFQSKGGASSISQSFTVSEDFSPERFSLYAGDGMGTNGDTPVKIALYDLGILDSVNVNTYESNINMLGEADDLNISYKPQAPGLINMDLALPNQIILKAGNVYVFELQGAKGTAPIYLPRSVTDVYSEGNAYRDRTILSDDEKKYDFGLAVYGKRISK